MTAPSPATAPASLAADRRGRQLRLTLLTAVAATLAVGGTAAAAPSAAPSPTPSTAPSAATGLPPRQDSHAGAHASLTLPAPGGSHPVGTTSLHLVDGSRPDPWVSSRPHRELMVSIRYPARDAGRYPFAPQMLPGEAAGFDALNNLSGVPKGKVDWAATRTHAHRSAPVDRRGGRLPVLLYSPGVLDPRGLDSTLVDDLASRGYAVVTIDHTYEASAVEFPGGRVERSRLMEEYAKADREGRVPELLKKVTAVRVADTRFVLDQLDRLAAGHNPDAGHGPLPKGLRGALDTRRTGMFGQSGGGFTAAQTMHDDRRIKAAVNMDGYMGYTQEGDDPSNPSTVGRDGVDRPLLLMGHEGNDHHSVASWGAVWEHSSGWHRDLTLTGSKHATFSDAEVLLPQIARQLDLPERTVTDTIGTIDPDRAVVAQRAYVAAFFDRWLLDRDSRLLDGPSDRFPEVRFVP